MFTLPRRVVTPCILASCLFVDAFQLPSSSEIITRNSLSSTRNSISSIRREYHDKGSTTRTYESTLQTQQYDESNRYEDYKMAPSKKGTYKKIHKLQKFARLPVWPVWSGIALFLLSKVLPNNIISNLEHSLFGGRVCPNFFSETGINTSPFILLVHHVHTFTPFDIIRHFQKAFILPEGFPSHPHRGFITLTYCMRGGMVHRDSMGSKQRYGSDKSRHDNNFGQWLIAGAGMLHEEMWDIPVNESNFLKSSEQELYQLWINLPSKYKMTSPRVQLLSHNNNRFEDEQHDKGDSNDDVSAYSPTVISKNGNIKTIVLVGEYNGMKSQIETCSPMTILHVQLMKPNGESINSDDTSWSITLPESFRTSIIYVRNGSLSLITDDSTYASEIFVPAHHTAFLTPSGTVLSVKAGKDKGSGDILADFILLAGEPINEPVMAQGSMVMNYPDEINQAYSDYQRGLMGLPWDHKLTDEQWMEHVKKHPSKYRS